MPVFKQEQVRDECHSDNCGTVLEEQRIECKSGHRKEPCEAAAEEVERQWKFYNTEGNSCSEGDHQGGWGVSEHKCSLEWC